jgi:hypothetical protein
MRRRFKVFMLCLVVRAALVYSLAMNMPRLSLFPILDAAEPLRKRAPAVDENGRALSDFMVIIPDLRKRPQLRIQQTMQDIHRILSRFGDQVVFAEVNLKLNLLWVSIRPVEGIRFEITEALRGSIPDVRLVSHI